MELNKISDQMDLNSPNFNERVYVHEFLKQSTIQNLIEKNNKLQSEIKTQDQEIQNLVFDNYNKFISSIDTVKRMKTEIINVEQKMKTLEDTMNKITEIALNIDDTLKIKREEIKKLDTVNNDLQKLSNLCEFPDILEAEIQHYQKLLQTKQPFDLSFIFEKSLNSYQICFQMLVQFKEDPLVKPLYLDSIEKVERIRSILWSSWSSQKQNVQDISVNKVNKLESETKFKILTKKLILIMEDQQSILRNYLKTVKESIQTEVKLLFETEFKVRTVSNNKDKEEAELEEYLQSNLYSVTLEQLDEKLTTIQKTTLQNEIHQQGSLLQCITNMCEKVFTKANQELHFFFNEILGSIDKNNKPLFQGFMEQSLKEILTELMEKITQNLQKSILSNYQINEICKIIFQNITKIVTSYVQITKKTKIEIFDKFYENIEHICRNQIISAFLQARNTILSVFTKVAIQSDKIYQHLKQKTEETPDLEGLLKSELASLVTSTKNQITTIFMKSLLFISTFLLVDEPYLKDNQMFLDLVIQQFGELLASALNLVYLRNGEASVEILQIFEKGVIQRIGHSKTEESPICLRLKDFKAHPQNSIYYLFQQIFLNSFSTSLVQEIIQIFKNIINTKNTNHQLTLLQVSQIQTELDQNILVSVQQTIKLNESKIFKNYSFYWTEELLLTLKQNQYFTFDQIEIEKEGVSSLMSTISAQIKQILFELGILFPDNKRQFQKKSSFLKFESSFNIEMEKIVIKKAHHFEKNTEFSRNILMLTIFKGFFKTLIEKIRLLDSITPIFHKQIQVDLYFMIQNFYELVAVDDESLITGFYFEILDSLNEICTEPLKIDPQQLDHLFNSFRLQLKI